MDLLLDVDLPFNDSVFHFSLSRSDGLSLTAPCYRLHRVELPAVVAPDRVLPDVLGRDVPPASVVPRTFEHDSDADLLKPSVFPVSFSL